MRNEHVIHDCAEGTYFVKSEAFETTLTLCLSLLEEIGSPRSLSICILIRYKEWDQVANGLPIDALDYLDHESFFRDYQATKLLTKADFLPTSFDRMDVALVRFERAESQCQETNQRVRHSAFGVGVNYPENDIGAVILAAQCSIRRLLGDFPKDRLLDHCRWGPGATTSVRNPRTSAYEKYLEPVTGSGPCLALFFPLVGEVALWKSFQREFPCVSNGNKVVFVPKDAKTLRSIAMEPSFDSFIQLGIGQLLRDRLRLIGVNLNSQELNQNLARYGSLTGKVATVDLSMASDTVSKAVVELMLPPSWWLAMKSCRSTSWRRGEKFGVYHKFSSMGNGYTFELETLIFHCIARAVCERLGLPPWEVSTYGDDITIGVEGVGLLERTLSYLGFSFNGSKSFSFGPFRESCGKDYFLGNDVRPYFIRSLLRDVRDVFKFHNGIKKTCISFEKTAQEAVSLVRPEYRFYGPSSLGDTVLHSPIPRGDFKIASTRWPMYEGFIVRHWVFKPQSTMVKFYEPAILASLATIKSGESATQGKSTLRKRGIWKTRAVLIPSWDE